MRRKKLILLAPLAVLGLLLFVFIGGEVVKQLWNWLLPPLFGWRQVTFWQALGILALCRILFGGFGHGRPVSFQHSPADVRAMGEHEPRGTRTASTGPARPLRLRPIHEREQRTDAIAWDRYETAASRMVNSFQSRRRSVEPSRCYRVGCAAVPRQVPSALADNMNYLCICSSMQDPTGRGQSPITD